MREALAVRDLGPGLDRPLRVLDQGGGTRARGEERLVAVGHAAAEPDSADQRGNDHQTASTATRLFLVLCHALVEFGIRLAVGVWPCERGRLVRLELVALGLGISLARRRHVVAEI